MPSKPLNQLSPSEREVIETALMKKIISLIKAGKGMDDDTFYEKLAQRTGYSVADVRFVVESRISVRVEYDPKLRKDRVQLNRSY